MSKFIEVRKAMAECIGDLDISFNLNVYANLGIVSLTTPSVEATFMLQGSHESFTVDTMQGIDSYDLSKGDDVWDVATIKATLTKALQYGHGIS